jgi:hypothetical protein
MSLPCGRKDLQFYTSVSRTLTYSPTTIDAISLVIGLEKEVKFGGSTPSGTTTRRDRYRALVSVPLNECGFQGDEAVRRRPSVPAMRRCLGDLNRIHKYAVPSGKIIRASLA